MTDLDDTVKAKAIAAATIATGQVVSFAPGQLVGGKYKILSLIGKGGMGTVYRVQQVFLNIEVALKVLDSRTVVADVQRQRFQLEARAAYTLNHPNLVKVQDFGLLEDDAPYLVMELVDGVTLADYIKERGPLPPVVAAEIFAQACSGLASAHEQSIVHRDIKPSNIMLLSSLAPGAPGSVKIVDFGIAKLASQEGGDIQALTRTGEVFGSPLYMSPEQCSGERVDHRADIYSLGCTLFEALTGTPPHVGANALRTMMLHQTGPIPLLKEASLGNEFPPALEHVVQKMLAKAPHERYQDLNAAAADLIIACDANSVDASGYEKSSRKNKFSVQQPPKPVQTVSLTRRKLYVLSSIAVGLLCLTVWGTAFIYDNMRHATSSEKSSTPIFSSKSSGFLPNTSSSSNLDAPTPLADKSLLNGSEVDTVVVDLRRKRDSDAAKAKEAFENAVPMKSSIVDGTNQLTITFPPYAIGNLSNRTIATDSGGGKSQPWMHEAQGVVYLPGKFPVTLSTGGLDYVQALQNPKIFERIGPDEISELIIDYCPHTQLQKGGTLAFDWQPDNIAMILNTASHWSKLNSVILNHIPVNKKILAALDQIKGLRKLQLTNPGDISEELAATPFLLQLEVLVLCRYPAPCDEIICTVANSPHLQKLILEASPFSSTALASVRACPTLEYLQLELNSKKLDDATMAALCRLKHLKCLYLKRTVVTYEQVDMLAKECPWLKSICVDRPCLHDTPGKARPPGWSHSAHHIVNILEATRPSE